MTLMAAEALASVASAMGGPEAVAITVTMAHKDYAASSGMQMLGNDMKFKIFENDTEINRIVASEEFVKSYCVENGYTYEAIEPEPTPEVVPEPSQLDRVEAQATYTAMMTDTLLPEEV